MRTPEYARFLAAIEKSESFRLELRGPDGSIIPTEDVAVRDFGFLDEPGYDLLEEEFEEDLSDSERQEEFGEETLASLGLDDWDATWDLNADADDQFGDFDESRADEPWRGEERVYDRRWSRYQLQVELVDESSVP